MCKFQQGTPSGYTNYKKAYLPLGSLQPVPEPVLAAGLPPSVALLARCPGVEQRTHRSVRGRGVVVGPSGERRSSRQRGGVGKGAQAGCSDLFRPQGPLLSVVYTWHIVGSGYERLMTCWFELKIILDLSFS